MASKSIADYTEAELRSRRQSTALIAAVVAVTLGAAVWISTFPATSSTLVAIPSGEVPAKVTAINDANPELATMLQKLTAIEVDDNDASLREAIEKLTADVSALTVTADSSAGKQVSEGLSALLNQTTTVATNDNQPQVISDEEMEARLQASITERRIQDELEKKQAVELAVASLRGAREPEVRQAELSIRDAEDQIEQLRLRINRLQQTHSNDQAKAARAAALQRDLTNVRAYLSPFITPGYIQPRENGKSYKIETTVDAKPVSLTRLQRTGALEPTIVGLERLHRFGGARKTEGSDRPLGAFPEYGWAGDIKRADIRQRVQFAQDLLRVHGQALVDAHLLSP